MTEQKISIFNSSHITRESFCSHIKNAIFQSSSKNNDYVLDHLHKKLIDNEKLIYGTDQATLFHKAVYSTFDQSNFYSTKFWFYYKKLCLEIVDKLKNKTDYHGEWSIQRFPTFRFHFPNNVSVFEFHRDSDYQHPLGEINCFYAITECKNSSALHIEKNLGFEDYVPLNLKSGEYAILNTSIFKHGDLINKTTKTRVSMDFRFIPDINLNNTKVSKSNSLKLTSDEYFMKESEIKI